MTSSDSEDLLTKYGLILCVGPGNQVNPPGGLSHIFRTGCLLAEIEIMNLQLKKSFKLPHFPFF